MLSDYACLFSLYNYYAVLLSFSIKHELYKQKYQPSSENGVFLKMFGRLTQKVCCALTIQYIIYRMV